MTVPYPGPFIIFVILHLTTFFKIDQITLNILVLQSMAHARFCLLGSLFLYL